MSTKCEVCFEEMVEPRSLPCGHTYCKKCLQELVDRANNIMCPSSDRSIFPVPGGNADRLMRNYYLENVLDDLHKSREKAAEATVTCAEHADRQAELSCVKSVSKFKQEVDNEKTAITGAVEAQVDACQRKVDAAVSKIREIVQVLNATADGLQNTAAQHRQLIQAASASKLATLDGLQREVAAFSFPYNDCTLESRLKQVDELTQKLEVQRGKLTSENIPDASRWFSDSQLTCSLETILNYATKLKQNLTKNTHDFWQLFKAALNEQQKQILVLAGGGLDDNVMAYDTSSDTWAKVASMSCQRWGTAATLWQGKVVVAGGFNSTNKYLNTVEQFDPESNSWTALPDMLHKRSTLALACLDNTLYAIGGSDSSYLASVERFDSNTKRWQLTAPLKVQRAGLCCAVLRITLLAVGGSDGSKVLDTCELFDGAKQKWELAASLQTARSQASASTVDDKFYVFGGLDKGGKCLDSVEEYAAGMWTLLPVRISVARCHLAAATVNGRVYVCGGVPEGTLVECFDASTRQISRVAQLPKDFDCVAAASVAVSNQARSRLLVTKE